MNSGVNLLGKHLKNPVIAASGTFGFGREYEEYFDLSLLGGISTKGLTIEPREGNAGIRIYETRAGIMNSIGLQNPGVQAFISDELPYLIEKDTAILANLGGGTLEDYIKGVELLNETAVDFIELNISCPNVKCGGMAFGIREEDAFRVVSAVNEVSKKRLIVKLSPNAENIRRMAESCVRAGADALSLVNTFNALAIDVRRRKPVFNNVTAGFSGPAIKPIALRMVYEVAKTVDVPIIGMGGISNGLDAIEFIMAGATAVQVGSVNFIEPSACCLIVHEIEEFMGQEGIESLEEIRGII